MRQTVLIVSGVFPPEQVTSAFLNYDLAKRLSEDYNVIVLRPRPTRPIGAKFGTDIWQDDSFKTIQIDSYTHPASNLIGRLREAVDFSYKCSKYINKHHREISFVYNGAWQLFGLYLIAKTCVKYRLPYIVPIQDIYPESLFTNKVYHSIFRKVLGRILLYFDKYYQKNAAKVRTITSEMADYLSTTRHINRDKYLTINNWQNDEDFMELQWTPHSDKAIFAYVGSINEHANVDLIIRAFIKANLKDAELRIYGGGNQKDKCIELVKEFGADNIFFDFVSRKDIPQIQSKADALVLALPKGNGKLCLPSKLTSYMLSSKPVIASVDADSSTSRIIQTEQCGIAVAPDDVDLLCNAFILFKSKCIQEKKAMGCRSWNYAIKHLKREVNLNRLVNEIKKVI